MSETWEEAILHTMKRLGGKGLPLQKIYKGMETHSLVTPYHGQSWKPDKQARYECWIRSVLARLKKKGLVKQIARAIYSLT